MNIFRKLFRRQQREEQVVFSRGSPEPIAAEPGAERETFIRQVAVVLECDPSDVNTSASLTKEYELADLDVSECVQIAEEAWRVQLMPNPMTLADADQMMKRFPTLDAIIAAAEGERASGT